MTRPMTRSRRRRPRAGFTLMEVVFAVAIVATALIALQATVAGSIQSAGSSVNRRAAREECRAKLEEILAGVASPDGGGGGKDGGATTSTAEEGMETITMASVMPFDEAQQQPAAGTGQ